MTDYYNSESAHRRYVKGLIMNGDLTMIKNINNLTPSCPYNGYGPLDPIYTSIEHHSSFMVPYFVEERHLTSMYGLKKALECNDFKTAIYLHDHKFPLSHDTNYVYSLDCMKLVVSWGYMFDDTAVVDIFHTWSEEDVVLERLKYLFNIKKIFINTLHYYTCRVTDNIAIFLIDYTDINLYIQILRLAINNDWITTIEKLIALNILDVNIMCASVELPTEIIKLILKELYKIEMATPPALESYFES